MSQNLYNNPSNQEWVESERTVFLVTAKEKYWQRRVMQSPAMMESTILAGVFSTLEQAQERANALSEEAVEVIEIIAVPVNAISRATIAEIELPE